MDILGPVIIITLIVLAILPEEFWKKAEMICSHTLAFSRGLFSFLDDLYAFLKKLFEPVGIVFREGAKCATELVKNLQTSFLDLFKKAPGEEKVDDSKIKEFVFNAYQKLRNGDPEGQKELIVLISKYGKKKILRILREIEEWWERTQNEEAIESACKKTVD